MAAIRRKDTKPELMIRRWLHAKGFATGYRTGAFVGIVWKCALKGHGKRPLTEVIDSLSLWLSSGTKQFCVEGQWID